MNVSKNKNYSILYIANCSKIGGGNRSLLTIIEYVKKLQNFSITVFVPNEGKLCDELDALDITYYIMPSLKGKESKFKILIRYLSYFLRVKHISPDLIHVNDLFCYRPIGGIAKFLNIPICCHFRFSVSHENVNYFLKPLPDMLFFNSNYMLKKFQKNNPSLAFLPKKVIYNAFDIDNYFKLDIRAKIRLNWGVREQFVVGMIGNFHEVKGHKIFLQIAKKLISKYDDILFMIFGEDILYDGKFKKEIYNQAAKLEVLNKLFFMGFNDDIGSVLSGLDLLVVPSLFESFGRVAVEGLLAGLNVVASNVGGLVEILEDNPNGTLVSPNDIEAFCKVIETKYLEYKKVKGEIKRHNNDIGVKLAKEKFGLNKNINILLDSYISLLKRK